MNFVIYISQEVKHQSVLFLVAGYETTSTALSYVSYLLAIYPEIQQKLQQEIDLHVPDEVNKRWN